MAYSSYVYKWNSTTQLFNAVQAITTNVANDFESFTINGEQYLAVANGNTSSYVYKWNGTEFDTTSPVNEIITENAKDIEAFTINGEHFIAVINDGVPPFGLGPTIYRWNGTQFDTTTPVYSSLNSSGSWDWESFILNGEQYLAIANLWMQAYVNLMLLEPKRMAII